MNERTTGRRSVTVWACAILVAVMAIGTAATSSVAAPPAMRMNSAKSLEKADAGLPGSLEDNDGLTQSYFLNLGWADGLDSGSWEGPYGPNDVKIRVVAANPSPSNVWYDAINPGTKKYSGHLVMKIIVLDSRNLPELGLNSGDVGFLWIGKRGNGNANGQGAAIYTVKPNGKGAKRVKNMIVTGRCRRDHGDRPMAMVRAGDECTEPIGVDAAAAAANDVVFPAFRTRAGPAPLVAGSGLWVTCTGGCCEVRSY